MVVFFFADFCYVDKRSKEIQRCKRSEFTGILPLGGWLTARMVKMSPEKERLTNPTKVTVRPAP